MKRRAIRRIALLALAAAPLAGCDGDGVVSPNGHLVARGGGPSVSTALVGTWRRAIFFLDEFGFARATETTWQFGSNGAVTRVQVARNFTIGIADVQVAAGSYRYDGARVVIDLVTPAPQQLQFAVRFTSDGLELAGQAYLRVTD